MMKLLVFLKEIFQKFLQSLETFLKVIILSKFSIKISRIERKKKSVLILANGPSLKNFKLTETFRSEFDLLTVNHSPDSDFFEEAKPQYHIINAPELWRNDVSDYYKKASKILFNQLNDKVIWPMVLFIPFSARKYKIWQEQISQNTNISIIYYNTTPVEGFRGLNYYMFKLNLGMPRPHNVLIPSLILLINVGYENIYLLGVDHSWLPEITVTENNDVLIRQKHFYDEAEAKSLPMNKKGNGTRKLHEVLHKFYLTFRGYFDIEDYAVLRNVKIYNSTPNSFIDAFERKNLNNDTYAQ